MNMLKNTFVLFTFFTCFTLTSFSQYDWIDSQKMELKKPMHDTARLRILHDLVQFTPDLEWQAYNHQMMKLAAGHLQDADSTLRQAYLTYLSAAYYYQGVDEAEKTHWPEAIGWYKKSLYIMWELQDTLNVATTLNELARIHEDIGDYRSAIDLSLLSLKTAEMKNDDREIANAYRTTGTIYDALGDPGRARMYFRKAMTRYKRANYVIGFYRAANQLADSYDEQQKSVWALHYYKQTYDSYDSLQQADYVSGQLYLRGLIAFREGRPGDAAAPVLQAIELARESGTIIRLVRCDLLMGDIYLGQKNYSHAEQYMNEAYTLGSQSGNIRMQEKAAALGYRLYKSWNRPADALRMLELQKRISDERHLTEIKNNVLEQQLKADFEKREVRAEAERESRMADVQLTASRTNARKNNWIIGLAALTALLALSAWFLYKYFRQKTIIAVQKNDLLQQKLLVTQMNPHFIFNSLNAIQNYIYKREAAIAGAYLGKFSELIRMILEFSRRDYISVEDEHRFLVSYLDAQKLRFKEKLDYTISIDEEVDTLHTFIPPMLSQPFIENAIEHGIFYKQDPGHIGVRIFYREDNLVYEVEDDGVGLEMAAALQNRTESHQSLGTQITRERLQVHHKNNRGEVDFLMVDKKSADARATGVKVIFSIPYKIA